MPGRGDPRAGALGRLCVDSPPWWGGHDSGWSQQSENCTLHISCCRWCTVPGGCYDSRRDTRGMEGRLTVTNRTEYYGWMVSVAVRLGSRSARRLSSRMSGPSTGLSTTYCLCGIRANGASCAVTKRVLETDEGTSESCNWTQAARAQSLRAQVSP